MSNQSWQREQARYILSGELVTETGLHVGSGYGSPRTDATVVRDFWGRPYIPGSSFKGALRSAVERLIAGLAGAHVTSCQLTEGCKVCLTTDPDRQRVWQDLVDQRPVEDELVKLLVDREKGLCDTCRLFGSHYSQARLYVSDLPLAEGQPASDAGEIRHGVGIDRDTLTARERIKYDFEALPSQLRFVAELIVDRPSAVDLGLLALGLKELQLGFITLGGIRSRGLGRCRLTLTQTRQIDLADKKALLTALSADRRAAAGAALDPAQFITDHLAGLVKVL